MSIFEGVDLGGLQEIVYPVLEMLTGVDVEEFVSGKAPAMHAAAAGFHEVAELFEISALATDDGIYTNEEVNAVIKEARDIPAAIAAIKEAFSSLPDEV